MDIAVIFRRLWFIAVSFPFGLVCPLREQEFPFVGRAVPAMGGFLKDLGHSDVMPPVSVAVFVVLLSVLPQDGEVPCQKCRFLSIPLIGN